MHLPPPPHITPSDTNLIPRREFVREHHTPSSFAILALAGSCQIRLYSFPSPVIAAVRRLLDKTRKVIGHREDVLKNYVELAIDGKPWSNPKSIPTERTLNDIIAVLLQHGFDFLSTLDYGREQDDRIIMAFSKPIVATALPPTHGSPVPVRDSSGSSSIPLPGSSVLVKVPFALSFPNATTLRVISPPLASTPAILQTVRGSWPRGVVSEKKVGANSYEFKLKGYRWFQEDTFATDSLGYILTLLGSLDGFGFKLMASLSVANRSRAKDLWIFTGVSDITQLDTPPSSNASDSRAEFRPVASPEPRQRKRSNSLPSDTRSPLAGLTIPELGHTTGHVRAATSPTPHGHSDGNPHTAAVLRKPAPRAQLPVSVASSNVSNDDVSLAAGLSPRRRSEELIRAPMLSDVGSAVNMTGIGAHHVLSPSHYPPRDAPPRTPLQPPDDPTPTIFYATPPRDHNPYFPPTPAPAVAAVPISAAPLPSSSPPRSPPLNKPPPENLEALVGHPPLYNPGVNMPSPTDDTMTPPLLSPDAFRDSAFSTGSVQTKEIPITWTGPHEDPSTDPPSKPGRMSPVLPGGWRTPIKETVPEEPADADNAFAHVRPSLDSLRPRPHDMTPEYREVNVAIAVRHSPDAERKSEAIVMGDTTQYPKTAQPENDRLASPVHATTGTSEHKIPSGEGWVLVSVSPSSPSSPSTKDPHSDGGKVPPHLSPHSDGRSHPYESRAKDTPAKADVGGARIVHEGQSQASNSRDVGDSDTGGTSPSTSRQDTHSNSSSKATASSAPHGRENPTGSLSPTAKAIVIMDALEEKRKAGKILSSDDDTASTSSPSGLRRIFSQSSRDKDKSKSSARSRKMSGGVKKSKTFEQEEEEREKARLEAEEGSRKRNGLRERWRRLGVPEVSKSERRMSVD
ncbi:hypothetical protein OF83DRAFT_1168237 [Amylostereum chailletii]|nr:hypothetical protein OF83DRAFT_1168237 [Amylostereum chailletii]